MDPEELELELATRHCVNCKFWARKEPITEWGFCEAVKLGYFAGMVRPSPPSLETCEVFSCGFFVRREINETTTDKEFDQLRTELREKFGFDVNVESRLWTPGLFDKATDCSHLRTLGQEFASDFAMTPQQRDAHLKQWQKWTDDLFREALEHSSPVRSRIALSNLASAEWELSRKMIGLKKQIADARAAKDPEGVLVLQEENRAVETMMRNLAEQMQKLSELSS